MTVHHAFVNTEKVRPTSIAEVGCFKLLQLCLFKQTHIHADLINTHDAAVDQTFIYIKNDSEPLKCPHAFVNTEKVRPTSIAGVGCFKLSQLWWFKQTHI